MPQTILVPRYRFGLMILGIIATIMAFIGASHADGPLYNDELRGGDGQEPRADVTDRLASTLPMFARESRPDDWLPYSIMHSPLGDDVGHPGDARRLAIDGKKRYFLTPNEEGQVCLLITHGDAEDLVGFRTCSSYESFETSGLSIATGAGSDEEFVSALPGTSPRVAVSVTGATGTQESKRSAPTGLVRIPIERHEVGASSEVEVHLRAAMDNRAPLAVEFGVGGQGRRDG